MLRMHQNLSLQQKMAPQLIQSLQLLQMSTLELELEIKQQLEINPLLEIVEQMDVDLEESSTDTADEGLKEEAELPQTDEDVDLSALLEDRFDQNSYNNDVEYDPNWEVDREPRENRITTIPPLVEQLYDQLRLSRLTEEERFIAEFIIGNIDDKGYLSCSTEEIAQDLHVEVEPVEKVLGVIQGFDPPGIGARSLGECLILQLAHRPEREREVAQQIVRFHMEDLLKRRFSRIMRALNLTEDDIKAALDLLAKLQPYPAAESTSDYANLLTLDTDVGYVVPDLIVEKVAEDWVVSLRDGTLPALRINASYEGLLKEKRQPGKNEVRTYVSRKLNDARWLLNAIEQRRTTMLKVARFLVLNQMDFFEKGPAHLKPMVLQDVADGVGMHVSTISRVSNGKYMQTPHGVFEIKYFFDSKVSRDDGGDDVSARSVKDKILRLIEEEEKSKPLSDQEIANILGKDGLRIARRTVAKYRDQLGINSQRYRKKMF